MQMVKEPGTLRVVRVHSALFYQNTEQPQCHDRYVLMKQDGIPSSLRAKQSHQRRSKSIRKSTRRRKSICNYGRIVKSRPNPST
jgi:hypothetical protein